MLSSSIFLLFPSCFVKGICTDQKIHDSQVGEGQPSSRLALFPVSMLLSWRWAAHHEQQLPSKRLHSCNHADSPWHNPSSTSGPPGHLRWSYQELGACAPSIQRLILFTISPSSDHRLLIRTAFGQLDEEDFPVDSKRCLWRRLQGNGARGSGFVGDLKFPPLLLCSPTFCPKRRAEYSWNWGRRISFGDCWEIPDF